MREVHASLLRIIIWISQQVHQRPRNKSECSKEHNIRR